jgi:hypothetical protein
VPYAATASAASRVFASAFTAHLQARDAKADSLAQQIQWRATQAPWLKVYMQYIQWFAVSNVIMLAVHCLHGSLSLHPLYELLSINDACDIGAFLMQVFALFTTNCSYCFIKNSGIC